VGVAKGLNLKTNKASLGFIYLFKVTNTKLEFVHKTPTETLPQSLGVIKGRLIAGIGSIL